MAGKWLKIKEIIFTKWDKLTHHKLNQRQNDWSGIIEVPEHFRAILEAHDESWYETHQTSPRSSETSELQDEIGNFKRSSETEAFEARNQERPRAS